VSGPEGLDLDQLHSYFARAVEGADGGELTAELISGGRSNLTYRVTDGEHRWVVRRPPLGHVLATAHDMGREYRVMTALAGTDVPVPRTRAMCDDPDVIGAPFYVMDEVDGAIVRTADDMARFTTEQATACSRELVDVLAHIHGVDYEAVGLGGFGRPEGFLERNLNRWGKQWEQNQTEPRPAVDELGRRLHAALPASGAPTIVHGDYRLDNTMLAPDDPGRIVAVLDWEMSTLGDPLTDLGLLLLYWGRSGEDAVNAAQTVAGPAGFLTGDEMVARYVEVSGRSAEHLDFYLVFAFYKLAIIVEGIHARYRMGKTLGEGFESMGDMVQSLADRALEVANASPTPALRG
jgi:aminoglycoside phosphotransferase (APT) family kinase protein